MRKIFSPTRKQASESDDSHMCPAPVPRATRIQNAESENVNNLHETKRIKLHARCLSSKPTACPSLRFDTGSGRDDDGGAEGSSCGAVASPRSPVWLAVEGA